MPEPTGPRSDYRDPDVVALEGKVIALCDRMDNLDAWRITFVHDQQQWHAEHENDNHQSFQRLYDKLDDAMSRPQPWVTVVISILTFIMGLLSGGLWFALNYANELRSGIAALQNIAK